MFLLKSFINKCFNPSLKMALKLMIDTGLRIGEIVELKRENFNSDFTLLTFTQKKNKRIHTRRISKNIALDLKQFNFIYDNSRKIKWETDYFFYTWGGLSYRKGGHIKRSQIGHFFKRFRRKHNLEEVYFTCKDGKQLHRISPHTIRHWYIYQLYKHTQHNMIATRDIIGHLDTKTTQRYCYAYDIKETENELVNQISLF